MRFNRTSLVVLTSGLMVLTGCGNTVIEGLDETQTAEPGVMLMTLFQDATGTTMTNASAAGTEITNTVSRTYFDFSGYTQVRAQFASSLTSATVRCRIEYSLDDGSSWSILVPNFAASTVANRTTRSDWGEIPDWALGSTVLVRAVIVGDGVLDPVIRYVRVELK